MTKNLKKVQLEGNRKVSRKREYYNLDMIISIGFRVNSKTAIKFRTWSNKLIKAYIVKGFNLNDDRFIKGNKKLVFLKYLIMYIFIINILTV